MTRIEKRATSNDRLRIAVDIGGTFTDGLAVLPASGRIWVAKTLTTPRDPGEAVSTVIIDLLKQVSSARGGAGPLQRDQEYSRHLVGRGAPPGVASPDTGAPAPPLGARDLPVTEVVHGTTLVTNTLIERKGARTGLVVTRGTRDVLTIAREIRYELYDLNLEIPKPLVPDDKRVEVDERLAAEGTVVAPLTEAGLAALMDRLEALQVEAVGV